MTFFRAIFLAAVQGITEFLPVSSSGHLVLFQKLFRLSGPVVLFDVLLHLGTLAAILIFFRKNLLLLVKNWKSHQKEWMFLAVGSIPIAFFGFWLNLRIERIFNSLNLVGIMWIFFGIFLLSTRWLVKRQLLQKKPPEAKWQDSLVVGFFQALALFPGVSRAGSTIIGGMFRKFSPETAFYLSFLLSIPAILGAVFLKLAAGNVGKIDLGVGTVSVIVSALVGYLSLKILKKTLMSDKFYFFGFYCLVLGLIVFLTTRYL